MAAESRSTDHIPCAALQRSAHLGLVEGIPFRDRHLGPERSARLRRPRGCRPSPGPQALSVSDGDVDFGYWHVVPAVRHRQRVVQPSARRPCRRAVAPCPLRRAPVRRLSRSAPTRRTGPMERRDQAAGDPDRLLPERPSAVSGGDLRRGGRDRRGTPDATARGAATVGRATAHTGAAPLARST